MSDPPASRAGRRKREPQTPAKPLPAKWGRRFRLPARPGARSRGHSCLILGTGEGGRKIHVVCAPRREYLAIITAYVPETDEWDSGFRIRRSEEHTSELQSLRHLVCRLLL